MPPVPERKLGQSLAPGMARPEDQRKLQTALSLHQAGQLDKAAELYRQLIARDQNNCYALHYLGLIEAARGNYPQAGTLLQRSLSGDPLNSQFIENYSTILFQTADYKSALELAERGLNLNKASAALLYIGAISLFRLERYEESIRLYDRLLALAPNHVVAINERGAALAAIGRYEDALASFVKALTLQPQYAETHVNAGKALSALKRYDEALGAYDKAVALKPELVDAWIARGTVLMRTERPIDALAAYDRALTLHLDSADAWLGRGNACNRLNDYAAALAAFDKALAIQPHLANAWLGRGNTFTELARFDAALAAYDSALKLEPDLAAAWFGRGVALTVHARDDEAFAAFDKAVRLAPELDYAFGARLFAKLSLCDWTDLKSEMAELLTMISSGLSACMPFESLAIVSSADAQLQCARLRVRSQRSFAPLWHGHVYEHDRIRVGYLSADLRDHAVGYLTAGAFERHDRSRFEVTALSLGPDQASPVRERIRGAVEHFIDLKGRRDEEIAALIREREIDIVVDLLGHTRHNRLGVLARRPAPIQVNYLGYSGTTGAGFIDYILADATVIPQEHCPAYSEQVVWLPDCYLVNDDKRAISALTPSRGECGLPEDAFVFCCFNNGYKLGPETFAVWMRLLQTLPDGVLWLSEGNAAAQAHLRREAASRGVAVDRLIFAARTPAAADHLARLRHADLFLDTLPYNAHTTACDALWAGVPIVTCLGTTFVGRVAASLLKAVGLDELVTHSLDDYEALALKLAQDPAALAAITDKLARHRNTFPLFDTARTTRQIEAAYTVMWQRYRNGEAARLPGEAKPIRIA